VFGIGGNELLIIAVFALIIFGPDKIPEIARTAGKAIQMFKRAQQDVEHVIKTELYAPEIFGGTAPESTLTKPNPAQVVDEAASASAIWSAVGENEDEEGEEE